MTTTIPDLPKMAELFDALRKGRHLCAEDGELFFALRDNREAFAGLFGKLGFDFQEHPRAFFYFRGTGQLSEGAERMAVFMFVLIEAQATQGRSVEEALMTLRFDPAELPHFQTERYRTYMKEVGVTGADDLRLLLKAMDRLGFLVLAPDGSFRFRPPACRFLDLCLNMLDSEESAPPETEGEVTGDE